MKVLQINSVCGIGSTGRIATDIHGILINKGYESYIAYGRSKPMNCDTAIRIGNNMDIFTHVVITRLFDLHGFGSKKATLDLLRKIDEISPDVIHLHNIHGYYVNVELLFEYLKNKKIPVVWTLHDCWSFTGHCTNFEYSGCDCWKLDGQHICIEKNSYPASLFINNSKDNFERKRKAFTGIKNLTIVTPSLWLENLVKQSFLCDYPVEVINNGIDLNIFRPIENNFRKKNKLENKFIILGVANVWTEKKGFNVFLELSNMLNENDIIVLVGLTEKQKKNLPKNIIGITRTNNVNDLAEIYSSADVFVNPTFEEVFGLTNVEALACGTPVITFDTGGSVECIDLNCGHIVSKGNVLELIKVINIVKDKGKKIYSNSCLDRAKKFFDKSIKTEEYINLYNKVVV